MSHEFIVARQYTFTALERVMFFSLLSFLHFSLTPQLFVTSFLQCSHLTWWAEVLFHVGTVTLVAHAALSLSERLFFIFQNEAAAYTYAVIFGVLVILVQVFHFSVITKTRMGHEQTHKDMRKSVDEFYENEKVRGSFVVPV